MAPLRRLCKKAIVLAALLCLPAVVLLVIPGQTSCPAGEKKPPTGEAPGGPGNDGPAPMVFSPDSRYLVFNTGYGLNLLDAGDGKQIRSFKALEDIRCVTSSPDGKLLAAAGKNGIVVWDSATSKFLARRKVHQDRATAVAFSPDGQVLLSAGVDATILLWDVVDLTGQRPPAPLSAQQLATLWQQLGGEDVAVAFQALWQLSRHPGQAVPLLRRQVQPAAPPDGDQLARWIAALGDDKFAVRSRATAALEKIGELAQPALQQALRKNLTLEHHQRIEQLLARIYEARLPLDQVKLVRAVELLEIIGTAEAQDLLQQLSRGAPQARLTWEAQASLRRLQTR